MNSDSEESSELSSSQDDDGSGDSDDDGVHKLMPKRAMEYECDGSDMEIFEMFETEESKEDSDDSLLADKIHFVPTKCQPADTKKFLVDDMELEIEVPTVTEDEHMPTET